MIVVLLALYTLGCAHVLRLSNRAGVGFGATAAIVAIAANVIGLFAGSTVRAFAALPLLVLGGVAAARAFRAAENQRHDSDEERHVSRAGMALVGLAIGEASIVVLVGFVWLLVEAT